MATTPYPVDLVLYINWAKLGSKSELKQHS